MAAMVGSVLRAWHAHAGAVFGVSFAAAAALLFNDVASSVQRQQRPVLSSAWLVGALGVVAALSLAAGIARGWRESPRKTAIVIGFLVVATVASSIPDRAIGFSLVVVALLVLLPAILYRVVARFGLAAPAPARTVSPGVSSTLSSSRVRPWMVFVGGFAVFTAWGVGSILLAQHRVTDFCATVAIDAPLGDFAERAQAAGYVVIRIPDRPGVRSHRIVAEGHAWLFARPACVVDHDGERVTAATVWSVD
jgi:hypothetical protein